MGRLQEILLEVETECFEKEMWEFAVINFFTLSENNSGKQLTEKFNDSLDNKFNSSSRNKVLLENMNISYMITEDNQLSEGIGDIFANITEKWEKVKSSWSSMLGVFKQWMEAAKLDIKEIIAILINDGFIAAFKTTMKKLFSGLRAMLELWTKTISKLQNLIFNGLKQGNIGHTLDEISVFLDTKLNKENDSGWIQIARSALGLGVVWLTYQIWSKMFFIGDWKYDFDFSTALGLISGTTDFQAVLGAEFIPTLGGLLAGLVTEAFELVIPCPPKCDWFGDFNLMAAGFVTAYIMATNGSLKDIKNSVIGQKVQTWLKSIDTNKHETVTGKEAQTLVNQGKTTLLTATA